MDFPNSITCIFCTLPILFLEATNVYSFQLFFITRAVTAEVEKIKRFNKCCILLLKLITVSDCDPAVSLCDKKQKISRDLCTVLTQLTLVTNKHTAPSTYLPDTRCPYLVFSLRGSHKTFDSLQSLIIFYSMLTGIKCCPVSVKWKQPICNMCRNSFTSKSSSLMMSWACKKKIFNLRDTWK